MSNAYLTSASATEWVERVDQDGESLFAPWQVKEIAATARGWVAGHSYGCGHGGHEEPRASVTGPTLADLVRYVGSEMLDHTDGAGRWAELGKRVQAEVEREGASIVWEQGEYE